MLYKALLSTNERVARGVDSRGPSCKPTGWELLHTSHAQELHNVKQNHHTSKTKIEDLLDQQSLSYCTLIAVPYHN